MFQTTYSRFQAILIDPDPRRQRRAVWALLVVAALAVGLVIGVAGPLVSLALAFVAIAGWVVLRSPLWGLVGIIAISTLLPFATLPFKIGFTPSFLDLAIFATFMVWIMAYALRSETRLETSSIGLVIALFLVIAAFTFAMGLQYARPTSNNLRQFMEMVISITLFFVVINVARQRDRLFLLARVLMLGGAAAATIGILFYIIPQSATVWALDRLARFGYPGGFGALRFINDDPEGVMRAIGTSIDPNVFGGLLILIGLITLPQLFTEKPLFARRWVALMLGLELACLFLTMSRGSMIGFAFGAVVIGLLRYRKLLALGLVAGILFLVLPVTQEYVQYMLVGLAGQDRSTQMRFGEYKDALNLIARYPVFGVGFTGVPEIDLYIGVSSLYLLMAENMGLIGLGVFLLAMAFFLNALFQGLRSQPDEQIAALLIGILGAIIGLLAAGVFDHYLFNLTYPHMTSLLWITVGIGMAAVGLAREQAEIASVRATDRST
ncbi:MAG: O-antigen ligase family protein [Caldilineales bacterium]|nr:O-antigen ligase family protein [Caldilineales bacterium]